MTPTRALIPPPTGRTRPIDMRRLKPGCKPMPVSHNGVSYASILQAANATGLPTRG